MLTLYNKKIIHEILLVIVTLNSVLFIQKHAFLHR
jgi:hypothetical protein